MEFGAGTVALVAITLFAAFANGALGYGFSSLTVPVALLFHSNRILNPALVLVEVFINLYVLFLNRSAIPAVCRSWRAITVLPALPQPLMQLAHSPRRLRSKPTTIAFRFTIQAKLWKMPMAQP